MNSGKMILYTQAFARKQIRYYVRSEALTEVTVDTRVFWVVTPCSSKTAWRFEVKYRFHLQGVDFTLPPASGGLLVGLLLVPEDGDDIFLRNVGLFSELHGDITNIIKQIQE
jgi:hypothetical protein